MLSLAVQVELPEVSNASGVDLDITERRLELTHAGVGYRCASGCPGPGPSTYVNPYPSPCP